MVLNIENDIQAIVATNEEEECIRSSFYDVFAEMRRKKQENKNIYL
jgi:hypothetical protein